MLKVTSPEGNTTSIQAPQDFERILNVRFLPQLECADAKIRKKIEARHKRALAKEWITPRQKWLGHYHAKGIRGELPIDLTIAWIDATIGYGVFTNRAIPTGSFVGEYTGLLRKRRFWGRWKNLYCFDYTIGERKSTSLVIDCQDSGNHTRFINHSDHPNLELVSVYCDERIHVILYAKTSIQAGTQLCYDYGTEYWEKRGKPKNLLAAE